MSKTYQVKVYGASDDLVELSGDIDQEFGSYEKPTYLLFNDGTQLKIEYAPDDTACWRIVVIENGYANIKIMGGVEDEETSGHGDGEAPDYSDVAILTSDKPLKLVKRGHRKLKPVEQNDGVDKAQRVIDYLIKSAPHAGFDDWWHDIEPDIQNQIMEDLSKLLTFSSPSNKKKTLCFTGTLSISRAKAKEMSEATGFDVVGSVTSGVDYVVVGQDAGSKVDKAHALDIPVIDEAEWLKLIGRE